MDWEIQGSYWAGILPAIFLVCWILAEFRTRRRIVRFGNPSVMGLSWRWTPRILGAVLLAVTLGCSVIILAGEETYPRAAKETAVTTLILDSEAFDSGNPVNAKNWQDLEDFIRRMIPDLSFGRLSVWRSGETAELLIPPTADVQGALNLLSRYRLFPEYGSPAPIQKSAEALVNPNSADKELVKLLVITARPPEDMSGVVHRISDDNPDRVLVVQLPTVDSPMQYGVRSVDRNWNWSRNRERLREFLKGPEDDAPAGSVGMLASWGPLQFLAFLGFAGLLAESLLGFVPSSVEM